MEYAKVIYIERRKVCSKCKIEKGEFDFSINHTGRDGLQADCKECERERK